MQQNQVTTPVLDKSKVKEVANASQTATATMITLGFRQRAHLHTNLSAVKSELVKMGEHPNERDFMDFWKGMEQSGAGSLILGRRGKQTRFEWNYSLREIAQIAIEGREAELKLFKTKAKALVEATLGPIAKAKAIPLAKPVAIPMPTYKAKPAFLFDITLRDGAAIQIVFPKEPTSTELGSLKAFFGA